MCVYIHIYLYMYTHTYMYVNQPFLICIVLLSCNFEYNQKPVTNSWAVFEMGFYIHSFQYKMFFKKMQNVP